MAFTRQALYLDFTYINLSKDCTCDGVYSITVVAASPLKTRGPPELRELQETLFILPGARRPQIKQPRNVEVQDF